MNPTENLGRHSLPPLKRNLVPRFDNKIKATPSNESKVTRVDDILVYTSRQREFIWAKDTWCSPHYLDAVHEEADDECIHGKLKEDKLHPRCRGTSLQVSSGGTRTSPRTEAWSAMQAEVLLSVFFRASSRGCRRRRRNSLLGEWAEQWPRWASGGLARN
jgi:hypothetical protein